MAKVTSIKGVYPIDAKIVKENGKPKLDENGLIVVDRKFFAEKLREVMAVFLTDGVVAKCGDCLAVTQSGGMWGVGTGYAVANGLQIPVDEPAEVIAQDEIGTGQYAYIVVAGRFETDNRDGAIYAVVTNSPSYQPVRDESVYELVLARIDWRGGFEDYRMDNGMCGPVAPLEEVDTESFMLALHTALSQFNLNVGEVESLPSGTNPTVVVRKPDMAGGEVYIDFGIPRGAPGRPGKDGDSAPTMYVQAEEPPLVPGSVWMVDDRSTSPHVITAIKVLELSPTYPGADVFPSDGLFPGGDSTWVDHVLAPGLVAGGGGGSGNANLVTLGHGSPQSPGSQGDVYVDIDSGDAYVMD